MATIFFFVKLGITLLSPTQLIERGRALVIALTGNANFTTPVPTTAQITAAADALEIAEAAVINNGGKQDYVTRRERERDLRNLITLLGSYVQVTSGGDPEKILSAGFQTRKSAEPIGLVGAPQNLRAIASVMPGEVDLRWDRVRGRLIYHVEICELDPQVPENWKSLTLLGNNTYHVAELKSFKPFNFRVRAIGAAGPGPLSDPAVAIPR